MGYDTADILEALKQIAREKSVDHKHLAETVRLGVQTAARKKYATAADVEAFFDEADGSIRVLVHKKVVAVAIDLGGEIDLEEAQLLKPKVRVGEIIPVEVPMAEFGRNAIQAAKQVLLQRVREAERGNVVAEYESKIGTIISGSISQVDRGSVIVKIGKTEGIIPPRELIFRDRFRIGDPVRALLKNVDEAQKGPLLVLSRTDPEFVRRLFENEVPEIFERVVEIRDIAREPGSRSKITVVSHDDRVDPVGACVGMKGARVQAIVRELGGERIDIVPWSSDPKILISRALQPARVLDVHLKDGEERKAVVVVGDDELLTAIGRRGGQNVRLAQRLTGWQIELKTLSQMGVEQGEADGTADIDLEELGEELGVRTVEKLIKAGKETLQDVLRTPAEALMEIPGIAEKTASRLLTQARQILELRASAQPGAARGPADPDEAESSAAAEAADEAATDVDTVVDATAADDATAQDAVVDDSGSEDGAAEDSTADDAVAADAAGEEPAGAGRDLGGEAERSAGATGEEAFDTDAGEPDGSASGTDDESREAGA